MDQRQLLPVIMERYGLSHLDFLSAVDRGFSGKNFIVTDREKKYFVKMYHHLLAAEVIREIHAVKFFYYERGIPVIVPIRDREGHTFFESGGRHYSVFPYVTGKTFESLPSVRGAASMGTILAKQHLLSIGHLSLLAKKDEFRGWNRSIFIRDEKRLLEHIDALAEPTAFDAAARAFIEYKSALSKADATAYEDLHLKNDYIIHGDFHNFNVFFSEDDTVSHVFDFERAMRGPRVIDVIYSLFLICFDFDHISGPDYEDEHDRARAFLTAYHHEFPLDREELKNGLHAYFLGELVHTHWIEFEYYFHGNHRVSALLPERNKRVRYVAENYDAIEEKFVEWLSL